MSLTPISTPFVKPCSTLVDMDVRVFFSVLIVYDWSAFVLFLKRVWNKTLAR